MKKNKKGFTLVELLVVIAIIGLLSTLTVLSLNSARARARDARRISDIKQIQTALEMYYNDASAYPASAGVTSSLPIAYGGNTYLAVVPTAPTPFDGSCTAVNNAYVYTSTGTVGATASYTLTYCLGSSSSSIGPGAHSAWPGGL